MPLGIGGVPGLTAIPSFPGKMMARAVIVVESGVQGGVGFATGITVSFGTGLSPGPSGGRVIGGLGLVLFLVWQWALTAGADGAAAGLGHCQVGSGADHFLAAYTATPPEALAISVAASGGDHGQVTVGFALQVSTGSGHLLFRSLRFAFTSTWTELASRAGFAGVVVRENGRSLSLPRRQVTQLAFCGFVPVTALRSLRSLCAEHPLGGLNVQGSAFWSQVHFTGQNSLPSTLRLPVSFIAEPTISGNNRFYIPA